MSQPYISVVVTGRNDNYGVNFLGRINTFIRSLDHQVRTWPGLLEIVVVEWNPQKERPALADELFKPKNISLRVITVDPEIHAEFDTRIPVLEMYGKNTGGRRANGEFVLITNPDIVFTQELVDFFGRRELDPACFYRTDRYDFYSDDIETQPVEDYPSFACKNTFVAHVLTGSPAVPQGSSMWDLPRTSPIGNKIHTNASGDFMLIHRSELDRIGGLYTSLEYRWHNDSYSVIRMDWFGLKQQCLSVPLCIFHQHHERTGADVPWNSQLALELGRTQGPGDWGLAGKTLTETIL